MSYSPVARSLPGIVPSNTYETRDGKYVVIGAIGDSIFKCLMHAIGRAYLAEDPALANNAGRVVRTEELDNGISGWTKRHDLDHVLNVIENAECRAERSTPSPTSSPIPHRVFKH